MKHLQFKRECICNAAQVRMLQIAREGSLAKEEMSRATNFIGKATHFVENEEHFTINANTLRGSISRVKRYNKVTWVSQETSSRLITQNHPHRA